MDIYMFLKPANSDTENGIKKKKMLPEKNHVQRKLENWKNFKSNVPEEHGHRVVT